MIDINAFTEFSFGLIVFGVFAFALIIQLLFYLGSFTRLAFYKTKATSTETPPVSIIICAKNEDDNLMEFLPSIFSQDYPSFEVVVVNDCSIDNTGDVLSEFARKHDNLKIVTIKPDDYYTHGKKFALLVGIKGASNEHLLMTDGDCKPSDNQWIKNMIHSFTSEAEIVLGYGAYEKLPGLLNKIIRYDTFYIALQYLSFSLARKTYMGIGRNLAYKKSLFFKMKGFASHYHIESGDDDLFVNEASNKKNVTISVQSHTISKVKKTLKSWIRQKRRHNTTYKQYKFSSKLRLSLLAGSQYLFFISFIVVLSIQFQPIIVLSLFGLRFLVQLLIFTKAMKLLSEKDLILLAPILEIVLMIVYPIISLSNLMMKKNKWK